MNLLIFALLVISTAAAPQNQKNELSLDDLNKQFKALQTRFEEFENSTLVLEKDLRSQLNASQTQLESLEASLKSGDFTLDQVFDYLKPQLQQLKCQKIANSTSWKKLSNGRQYHFSDQKLNWTAAKSYCEERGSKLASIRMDSDLDMLWNEKPQLHYGYWLSASDVGRRSGHFYWADGTKLERNSSWWYAGNPNTFGPGKTDHVYLFTHKLKDYESSAALFLICEMPLECQQ